MTTAELRAYLLQVDPDGTRPVYVEMGDDGWTGRDISVFVVDLLYYETDAVFDEDISADELPEITCVKIGRDDRPNMSLHEYIKWQAINRLVEGDQ